MYKEIIITIIIIVVIFGLDILTNNYTSNAVSRFIDNCSENYYLFDQDGNINKDVESLFVSLGKGSYNIWYNQ